MMKNLTIYFKYISFLLLVALVGWGVCVCGAVVHKTSTLYIQLQSLNSLFVKHFFDYFDPPFFKLKIVLLGDRSFVETDDILHILRGGT